MQRGTTRLLSLGHDLTNLSLHAIRSEAFFVCIGAGTQCVRSIGAAHHAIVYSDSAVGCGVVMGELDSQPLFFRLMGG